MVSHEINKRGRGRGRRQAPSIYNSILPLLPFSAMFLSSSSLFFSSFRIFLQLFYHSSDFLIFPSAHDSSPALSESISFSLPFLLFLLFFLVTFYSASSWLFL